MSDDSTRDDGHEKMAQTPLPWNPAELGIVHLVEPGLAAPTTSSVVEPDKNPPMTVKFEHVQDEHGHHVVVGREGKLTRCQDEPIRTPGAVQGFGVLVVLEEKEDVLLVRQVSENSSKILGLSPNFLFSLECFTDVLPEQQASSFWDGIPFLPEPTEKPNLEDQNSPHVFLLTGWGEPAPSDDQPRQSWTCWCAAHRLPSDQNLIVLELELEQDTHNPVHTPITGPYSSQVSSRSTTEPPKSSNGSEITLVGPRSTSSLAIEQSPLPTETGQETWTPSLDVIMQSTIPQSKSIPALERMRKVLGPPDSPASPGSAEDSPSRGRRKRRRQQTKPSPHALGAVDIFGIITQINEQLAAAVDLKTFLEVLVGIVKELTLFHRVLIYQFDESWNGKVVAELVDWSMTHDLYRGLQFPAGDIPPQARQLYATNQVRILYDRDLPTARLVARSEQDLAAPLDMTHCYLRAMSPIHLKYLSNMGVRASMSISIMTFGKLWGLIACHSYGPHGMRVSFPIRQLLKLLSQSVSRNVERLRFAHRLHTKRLINTVSSPHHPTGYIVSNAHDLLSLFDADYGVLVIGQGAKVLGPNHQGQEILAITDYLRVKAFSSIQVSQSIASDYPDLPLPSSPDILAGFLFIPLSKEGDDFIVFLRKGQLQAVHWAGKPEKADDPEAELEPRSSFKIWSETVRGRSKAWTDEQLETAGTLALVYGKFIEVWREKESAVNTTKLATLLLSNAQHEVRTPLNHIINYLELALNGELDPETRANLQRCHALSKNLLFNINDLLDLARLENDLESSQSETFHVANALEEATYSYKNEAARRNVDYKVEVADECPLTVTGDAKKIRAALQNLSANSLNQTSSGSIRVRCSPLETLSDDNDEELVTTGLEFSFSSTTPVEVEKVRGYFDVPAGPKSAVLSPGLGLGQYSGRHTASLLFNNKIAGLRLAVVAHLAEQLGGTLRVDSKPELGSQFTFTVPVSLALDDGESEPFSKSSKSSRRSSSTFHSCDSQLLEVL